MIFPRLYNRKTAQDLKRKRLYIEGSEKFEVDIDDIAESGKALYGFSTDTTIRKYLPLNFLRIHNKGGTNLKVYVNQKSDGEPVDDDTVFTFEGDFWTFLLENLDDSNQATGADINVLVQRIPTGG